MASESENSINPQNFEAFMVKYTDLMSQITPQERDAFYRHDMHNMLAPVGIVLEVLADEGLVHVADKEVFQRTLWTKTVKDSTGRLRNVPEHTYSTTEEMIKDYSALVHMATSVPLESAPPEFHRTLSIAPALQEVIHMFSSSIAMIENPTPEKAALMQRPLCKISTLATAHQIAYQREADPQVNIGEGVVLANLLSNAQKHKKRGTQVQIEVMSSGDIIISNTIDSTHYHEERKRREKAEYPQKTDPLEETDYPQRTRFGFRIIDLFATLLGNIEVGSVLEGYGGDYLLRTTVRRYQAAVTSGHGKEREQI